MQPDAALYRRWLASRDEAAFRELAQRHADLVHDVAWRVAGDEPSAEDALQAALLGLAEDGTDRPAEVGVRAWLARRAIDRARDLRASDRARARRERVVAESRGGETVDARPDEIYAELEAALARVDGDSAAVLSLRCLHGVAYSELAAILGVSEDAARARVHRAMERVREASGRRADSEAILATALGRLVPRRCSPVALERSVARAVAAVPGRGGASVAVSRAAVSRPIVVAAGLAVLVGLASLVGRRESSDASPGAAATPRDHSARAGPTLSGWVAPPGNAAPRASSAPPAPPGDGSAALGRRGSPTQIRVRAFDGRPLTVRPRRVPRPGDPTEASAELSLTVTPRESLELWNPSVMKDLDAGTGAWIDVATLIVPDPVPAALDVRLPAGDDPRLRTFRLRVLDDVTGEPLPNAYLDPGRYALDLGRVRADVSGTIEVPYARALRWHMTHGAHGSLVAVAAPGHEPRYGLGFSVDDWRAWDADGALPVRLRRWTAPKATLPLRVVHEDGRPASGLLVETRDFLLGRSFERTPHRTDADGRVDVLGPVPLVLDLTFEDSPIGTLVLEGRPAAEGAVPREIRLPRLVRVRLEIRDAPEGGPPFDASVGTRVRTVLDPAAEALLGQGGFGAEGSSFNDGSAGYYVERVDALRSPLSIELWIPLGAEALVQVGRHLDLRTWEHGRWRIQASEPGPITLVRMWGERERAPG